jgi:hypothetical protein
MSSTAGCRPANLISVSIKTNEPCGQHQWRRRHRDGDVTLVSLANEADRELVDLRDGLHHPGSYSNGDDEDWGVLHKNVSRRTKTPE